MDPKRNLSNSASFKKFEEDVLEFRYSMNDWILFLNSQQREMKEMLRALERRVKELELEKEIRDRRF